MRIFGCSSCRDLLTFPSCHLFRLQLCWRLWSVKSLSMHCSLSLSLSLWVKVTDVFHWCFSMRSYSEKWELFSRPWCWLCCYFLLFVCQMSIQTSEPWTLLCSVLHTGGVQPCLHVWLQALCFRVICLVVPVPWMQRFGSALRECRLEFEDELIWILLVKVQDHWDLKALPKPGL